MKFKILPLVLLAAFAVFWVMLISGNILWTSNTPPLQVLSDMDDQFKVKPQTQETFFNDLRSDREPIQYTMPRNGTKYVFETVEEAEAALVNDVPKTKMVLARGENRYNTFCAPCHNTNGDGRGPVVERGLTFLPHMNIAQGNTAAKTYTDQRIFHVISKGQGLMYPYADKLSEVDRWAVVHYLRALQNGEVSPVGAKVAASSSENRLLSTNEGGKE